MHTLTKSTSMNTSLTSVAAKWADFISDQRCWSSGFKCLYPGKRLTIAEAMLRVPWRLVATLCVSFWHVTVADLITALVRGELPILNRTNFMPLRERRWASPPPELYKCSDVKPKKREWLQMLAEPHKDDPISNLRSLVENVGMKSAYSLLRACFTKQHQVPS